MTDTPRSADPAEVSAFAFQVWSYKQGEVVAAMIHLGDRLGCYRALEGAGPVTAGELAARLGLQERWVLEWIRGQAAARLLEYRGEDRFELTPAGAAVLADEQHSLAFAAGAFTAPVPPETLDRLADAFRTGRGLTYDDHGARGAHRTERMLGPWARLALVPVIVPALDGVDAKLRAGARVADVGCGAGVSLCTLAAAYPASRFEGYDPSEHAIARAAHNVAEAGVANVELHRAGAEDLPDAGFDFVLTFDCLHDMTHPERAAAAIRRAIASDGTWLIKDIRSEPRFEDNLSRNPMLAMMYGFSVLTCMASALSEPDGAGLGTLGLDPVTAERMTRAAGFSSFVRHDFDDPANLYYEVRP